MISFTIPAIAQESHEVTQDTFIYTFSLLEQSESLKPQRTEDFNRVNVELQKLGISFVTTQPPNFLPMLKRHASL